MSRATCLVLAGATVVALASPALALEELPRGLARLSPEVVQRKVQVIDDPLERATVLSTAAAWRRGHAIDGAYATDVHLRTLVDRESGEPRWQVWHELDYAGAERKFSAVVYRTGDGLVEAPITSVVQWTDYSVDHDGFGHHARRARIVFDLPEQTVREIAAGFRAGSREPWRLRFRDAGGASVTAGLAPAEVAGLVQAYESWQGRSR